MLGDPNFTFYPTPNPNPNSSPFPNSHTPDSPAYQHGGVVMNATTNVSPILHPAIDFGVMTQPMMNIIQPVPCEVCNIICNTTGMLEKHKQGKKHLKNMQKVAGLLQKPTPSSVNVPTVGELENKKLTLLKNGASVEMLISCDLCNVICNNQDGFRAHVAGKKHVAKAANANGLLDPTSASRNKPDNPFHCEICKISCTSGELLNLHLAGKKHEQKLKESEQIPIPALVTSPGKPVENAEATEGRIVISQEGKPVISQEGKPVISQEGTPVVSQEGTPIISQEGTPIISQEGTPIISLEGKPVISQEGMPVVSQEGKPVVSQEGTPVISQEGKPVISREGKPVISQGGKPVSCELCRISCTSYEVLKTHISGKKHQKNLEKSEKTIGPNPAALVIKPITGPFAEPVTEPVAEPVTEPVTAPTPAVTSLVIGPQKQDTPKEEGKSVNVSGSKKTTKRPGNHEDVERKKQKILEGGGTVDAMRTCTECQVVCSSPDVYNSHLAGSKHAAMVLKQAETQAQATAEET